ncbi:MAG: GxxExxY protein [bacterium]|nr:GxxExxY protein [bacterium]
MGNSDLIYEEASQKILDSAYEVQNTLGTGFLEKVYENALVICLKEKGLQVTQQDPLKIYFKGNIIGDYVTDLIVNKKNNYRS